MNGSFATQIGGMAHGTVVGGQSLIMDQATSGPDLNKKVDSIVDAEALRSYVKDLMQELNKHSASHP